VIHGLWINFTKKAAAMMPTPPITKNTERQPKLWASQPISGAKATSEKYWAELKMAEAVPRSGPGNQAATMRALAGKDGDSARPTMKRIANSSDGHGQAAPDPREALQHREARPDRRAAV
jgi:hypothetical protein